MAKTTTLLCYLQPKAAFAAGTATSGRLDLPLTDHDVAEITNDGTIDIAGRYSIPGDEAPGPHHHRLTVLTPGLTGARAAMFTLQARARHAEASARVVIADEAVVELSVEIAAWVDDRDRPEAMRRDMAPTAFAARTVVEARRRAVDCREELERFRAAVTAGEIPTLHGYVAWPRAEVKALLSPDEVQVIKERADAILAVIEIHAADANRRAENARTEKRDAQHDAVCRIIAADHGAGATLLARFRADVAPEMEVGASVRRWASAQIGYILAPEEDTLGISMPRYEPTMTEAQWIQWLAIAGAVKKLPPKDGITFTVQAEEYDLGDEVVDHAGDSVLGVVRFACVEINVRDISWYGYVELKA